ncbi:hypothetical protein MMC28_001326 [Mycoblastus sanguinarius]|nr:hypothetical protein [Mycoblastus sanguinarius]
MSTLLAPPDNGHTPLRSKASPRSTPSNSARSSFSFQCPAEQQESNPQSSGDQSPIRGRSLIRGPADDRLSKRRIGPWSVDFDISAAKQRVLSRDLWAEPQDIDDSRDSVLEPLPYERFRASLSEELHRASTFDDSVDLTNFGGHRDTFAMLGFRRLQFEGLELPAAFFENLLHYIDFDTYLAVRLSCRSWSRAISRVRHVMLRPVAMLPAEILQNIFTRLSPEDFNAARHTCRAWMIASLEENILELMLKRGNWWGAAKADLALQEEHGPQRMVSVISRGWLLSKRLAFECSLRPDWTGNGLSGMASHRQLTPTGLRLTSETDFSQLGNGYSSTGNSQCGSAVHFTVSACNKFVLVAEGCIIYIYSLQGDAVPSTSHLYGGQLRPLTSVICPNRVLAVSMDTSSQRFAIAALLEGREGVVCDLHENTPTSRRPSSPRMSTTFDYRASVASPDLSGERTTTEATLPNAYCCLSDHVMAENIDGAAFHVRCGVDSRTTPATWTTDDSPPTSATNPHSLTPPSPTTGGIPLETGPRSLYRNLCSSEDPPRSVSICPQRRCVAFGCSAGIELHWIDALTGQNLNRRFPLTAPSDFLYFLPPRFGVDSPKKLRLISSAAHPTEKSGLESRFYPGSDHGLGWYVGLSGSQVWDGAWRGNGWCDHYRAVPLSDGWNVLFTDPEDGMLCVGSDAPPGEDATRLIRRVVFIGPWDWNGTGKIILPRVYAAGGELRWGVRVVAGYGEKVWLFVVPPEVFFEENRLEAGGLQQANGIGRAPPLRINGVEIGTVPSLVDVAVDATNGDLTVWAFAAGGMAFVWQIARGSQRPVEKRIVLRDGIVTSFRDSDGDITMSDAPGPALDFDGTTSVRRTLTRTPTVQIAPDRIIDKDGDVEMRDVDEDEGYASEFEQAGGTFAIYAPPLWGTWSENDDWLPDYLLHRGQGIEDEDMGIDLLEVSRIEFEIL